MLSLRKPTRVLISVVALLSLPLTALTITACGGRRQVTTQAVPQQVAGTTLTPNSPPICGVFDRPYLAPGSTGMSNPVMPPAGLGTLDERQSRMYVEGDLTGEYAPEDLNLISNGRARVGLDERAVYLANGLPAFYWNTQIADSRCRVLLYGILGEPNIDTAVYTCDNEIVHIGPVQPRLPCWRVEEVAPRAIEHAQHFDAAEVEQQWDILYGLLRRGQSMNDVEISFGTPYRTGTEAREDGTNAANHVYLDNTGDAYATYLTFVDRTLRGWRFPPDRRTYGGDRPRELGKCCYARHGSLSGCADPRPHQRRRWQWRTTYGDGRPWTFSHERREIQRAWHLPCSSFGQDDQRPQRKWHVHRLVRHQLWPRVPRRSVLRVEPRVPLVPPKVLATREQSFAL